ncbi:MAG: VOC family protein [Acidimicrobiales bacterium]
MGFHHVAVAVKDLRATHAFYSQVMGFDLVKVVTSHTEGGGWAKHAFYDTGAGGMIAFWELADDSIGDQWKSGLSVGLGLPTWVNHLAFDAGDLTQLDERRGHWQDNGITVVEIDHGFCRSIYATDPDGTMVEFCVTTRDFSAAERAEALGRLISDPVEFDPEPEITVHKPSPTPVPPILKPASVS